MYTYKFPIYPTKKQARIIENHLETLCKLYNKTLEIKINTYKNEGKNLTLFDLYKLLTKWRQEGQFPNIYVEVMRQCQCRIDAAFSRFFAKQSRFPRFKKKMRSLSYLQDGFKFQDNKIQISKIGRIRLNLNRDIKGNIKRLVIVRHSTRKFSISVTTDYSPKLDIGPSGIHVGIDLGVIKLATISDGTLIEKPNHIKRSEKDIARLNRRFQKEKSNKNHRSLAKAYEKLTNRRKDFIEKLSLDLVRKYDVIVFEDLNVQKIQEDNFKSINRAISDACWGMLIEKTKYKAESAGKKVILVNPANTSKTCSRCGKLHQLSLSDRKLKCSCGLLIDRDLNASYNILRVGLHSLDENPKMLPEKG